MSSKHSAELTNIFASYTDEIDISTEEFLDFLTSMSMVDLADVITAAIMLPDSGYSNGLSPIITGGIIDVIDSGLFPTNPEQMYELGRRLLASPYPKVREQGIHVMLDGAFAAPEDELTQLIIDAIYHPTDVWDFWHRLLDGTHKPDNKGIPIRVALRVLPHLQRAIQYEQQKSTHPLESTDSK